MHVHLVIIFKVCHKHWCITSDQALRTCIGAIIGPEPALMLMLQLAIIWKYVWATKVLMSTRKFKRLGHFLKS